MGAFQKQELFIELNISETKKLKDWRRWGIIMINILVGPNQLALMIGLNKKRKNTWWDLDKILNILNNFGAS